MLNKGLLLLCTGLVAAMFAVASTGVAGSRTVVLATILCGIYGLVASLLGLVVVLAAIFKGAD